MKIAPPLYLSKAVTSCWKCNNNFPVVGLVAPNHDDLEAKGYVVSLSNFICLPDEIFDFMHSACPSFSRNSTLPGYNFAHSCPHCATATGDNYLHKAGNPLSPCWEEDARKLTLHEVPLASQVEIEASVGFGNVEVILENALYVNS